MIDLRFQPMQDRVKDPLGRKTYVKSPFAKNVGAGYEDLERELKLLEATDIVIESGHQRTDIRNDGWPRSSAKATHHDIRLYFKCKHGTLRYECNAFSDWQSNIRAIGLWMQRQRLALEEWGIGSGGEAYRGFAQLPAGIAVAEWSNVEEAAKFLMEVQGIQPDTGTIRNIVASEDTAVTTSWPKSIAPRTSSRSTAAESLTPFLEGLDLRILTSHQVNGCNEHIHIEALDGPGPGGASHLYQCTIGEPGGPHPVSVQQICFQNGPIAEVGTNGTTHEALLAILEDRLAGFQSGPYANKFNDIALFYIRGAQDALKARTKERLLRGVEGTHTV